MFDASTVLKKRPFLIATYALLAVIIAFEISVTWLALHPTAAPDYRAYFIDQTTTCLNQPVSGAYQMGQTISFLPEGKEIAATLRVCGWTGPFEDGNSSIGQTSRLRFATGEVTGALKLSLDLVAITDERSPTQTVVVSVNGESIDTITVQPEIEQTFAFTLPAALIQDADGVLDVRLDYPTALQMTAMDSITRFRAIRLMSASLTTAR